MDKWEMGETVNRSSAEENIWPINRKDNLTIKRNIRYTTGYHFITT